MAYGQKNYLEIQGINGKYRISQIGCFLTSFCNLLERFGKGVSPLELNAAFKNGGVYIDVDDKIKDDLAWSSISKHNPNIVVTRTGLGAPSSNDVIVKFSGVNNPFGTHFCLVADHSKGLIVDSWDGQVKHWNTYGGPKSWAEYKDNTPKPVPTPVPVQAPAPVSVPNSSAITVQKGWGLSHVARNAGFVDWDNEARWASIASLNGSNDWRAFNKNLKVGQVIVVKIDSAPAPQQVTEQPKAPEVVNITIQAGWGLSHALKAAGYTKEQWENPAEWARVGALNGSPAGLKLKPNQVIKVYKTPLVIAPLSVPAPVVPAPEKVEAVAPVIPEQAPAVTEEKIEVKVIPTDPKAYQETFTPEDRVYIAQQSIVVKDMEGLHMDRQLAKDQKVNSGGRFVRSEVTYIRTKRSIADNIWYGVPEGALSKGQDPDAYVGPLTDDEEDDSLFDLDMATEARELLNNLSGREKVVAFLAKIQGFFIRIAQTLKLKKKEK